MNLTEPDPCFGPRIRLRDGAPVTGKMLAERILSVRLNDTFPRDLKALYEAARGTMCYGYFFSPIFNLSADQLYRVAEAGLRARVGRSKRDTLADLIRRAAAEGIIGEADAERLYAMRDLRNRSSHPESQPIFGHSHAVFTCEHVAWLLNTLFPEDVPADAT